MFSFVSQSHHESTALTCPWFKWILKFKIKYIYVLTLWITGDK